MRSIPWVMIWEVLYRGRWLLPIAVMGANFMPVALESALHHQGAIDPTDSSQVMMHLILIQLNVLMFGVAIMWAQGKPSRLYAAPLTTATLVTWTLVPAMVLMWLETVISMLLMNAMFGLNWPVWGPALFTAVGIAAVYAALWQTEKTGWIIVSLTFVGVVMGFWYKAKHGPIFAQAKYYWHEVTALDVATLGLFAALSFYAAIKGLARDRRGETLKPLGILAWLERLFDSPPMLGDPFRSPEEAQFWYVWVQKGWAMPVCAGFGIVLGLLGWTIFNRSPEELIKGFIGGGAILTIVGMLAGLLVGNCGPNDATFEMGNFLATRPLNTRAMSRIVLKTLVCTVLISWAIWASAFTVAYLAVWAAGFREQVHAQIHAQWGWWYFPITLLGPWVVATAGAAIGLTGRTWPLTLLSIGGTLLFMLGIIVPQLTLSRDGQILFTQGVMATCGVLCVLITIATYIMARRQSLVEPAALYLAAVIWIILCLPVVYAATILPDRIIANYVLAMGLLALAVAPFSTIPLALTYNRVR